MKKSLISVTIIMLTLTALNIQAAGGRQGQGGGQRGGGQGVGQGSASGDMKRERSRIHQQEPGQYQQGAMQQRREMNQNRIQQTAPAMDVVPDQQ